MIAPEELDALRKACVREACNPNAKIIEQLLAAYDEQAKRIAELEAENARLTHEIISVYQGLAAVQNKIVGRTQTG